MKGVPERMQGRFKFFAAVLIISVLVAIIGSTCFGFGQSVQISTGPVSVTDDGANFVLAV